MAGWSLQRWLRQHESTRTLLAGALFGGFGAYGALRGLDAARHDGTPGWVALALGTLAGLAVQGLAAYVAIVRQYQVSWARAALGRYPLLASWVGAFLLFYGSEPGLLAVAGGFWAGWAACMVAYFLAKGLRELRDPGLRQRLALAYASFLGRGTPMETFAGIPGERVAVDTLWQPDKLAAATSPRWASCWRATTSRCSERWPGRRPARPGRGWGRSTRAGS